MVSRRHSHFGILALLMICVLHSLRSNAQCVNPDFTAPATACLQQNINFTPDATYAQYAWDFCAGDLAFTPTAAAFVTNYGGYGFKVKIAQQGGSYYGFFLSRASSKLFRLDFGSDLNSQPLLTDLGGLGINSTSWRVIEIAQEGSAYYGFIIDNNLVYRISFGSSLSNAPSAPVQIFSGDPVSSPIDLVVVQDNTLKYLFIANLGNNKLVRMKFPSTWNDAAAAIVTDYVVVSPAALLSGISFLKDCNTWYCAATGIANGQVYNLAFAAGLNDPSPAITSLTVSSPAGIALVNENNQYYGFVQSQNPSPNADVSRLDYGSSLSNVPTVTVLSNIGISTASGMWGFSMYKSKSDWLVLSTENSGPNIFKLTFPSKCFSSTQFSTLKNPAVTTTTAGAFNVELKITDASGVVSAKSIALTVSSSTAPDITFSSQNVCAQHNINFTSSNTSGGITSYAWDFGDSQTSSGATTTHSYTAAGSYLVNLNVASASCQNTVQKSITVYNPPTAAFTLPTPSVVCTNQNYTFVNASAFDAPSNPTWQWNVNGTATAVSQDLTTSFTTTASQSIQLTATIPGCSSQSTQSFSVQQQGPSTNFSITGKCQIDVVQFTNQTTGSVNGYTWDFGDGNTTTGTDVQHSYSNTGTFNVKLGASNAAGCNNSVTKSVTIYTKPQPDFNMALPPFSCSGTATQFNDVTPVPVDSNLSGWGWTFGDPASGTSAQQNPKYTYNNAGPYTVGLTVTTNFNCSATVQKAVNISQSPIADFSTLPACVNQSTQFKDASGTGNKSWIWKISNSMISIQNPIFVFPTSGSFPVQLTVTGNNGCVAQVTKSVVVPVPLSPDFSFTGNCAGKQASFADLTTGIDTPASWLWNFDGKGTATGSHVTNAFASLGNAAVSLTVTAQSGCQYSVTKSIAIIAAPVAAFTTSVDNRAAPLAVDFTNTSVNATSYNWQFNDNANTTSQLTSPSFTYNDLGDYVASLTAYGAQNCSDTYSKIIHVIVPSIDIALEKFQFVRDDVTGKMKTIVFIENKGNVAVSNPSIVLDAAGAGSVEEQLNLTVAPGQTTSQLLNFLFSPATGSYVCLSVSEEGDTDLYNNKVCMTLAGEDVIFTPYPNPTSGEVHLDWITLDASNAQVKIFNVFGAKAFDKELPQASAGLNQVMIDISNLQPGVYLLVFKYGGVEKSFRLIRN